MLDVRGSDGQCPADSVRIRDVQICKYIYWNCVKYITEGRARIHAGEERQGCTVSCCWVKSEPNEGYNTIEYNNYLVHVNIQDKIVQWRITE